MWTLAKLTLPNAPAIRATGIPGIPVSTEAQDAVGACLSPYMYVQEAWRD